MKIEIIGRGPITPAQLDEILFGTSTINRKNPLEEAMDKLLDEVKRGATKTIMLDSLGNIAEEIEKDAVGKYSGKSICFDIQSITANHKKNAFTVVWGDGSHTMIHLQKGDVWDDEKALAMCFVKHMMGDKSSFNDIFTTEMPEKIKHIGKVEPVEEKVVKMAEAIKQLGDTAEETKESVEQFTVSCDKCADYPIFIKTRTAIVPAGHCYTIKGVKERVRELAIDELGCKPYYYRTWMEDDFLFIDFGSHSKFIVVKGMTIEDWRRA